MIDGGLVLSQRVQRRARFEMAQRFDGVGFDRYAGRGSRLAQPALQPQPTGQLRLDGGAGRCELRSTEEDLTRCTGLTLGFQQAGEFDPQTSV